MSAGGFHEGIKRAFADVPRTGHSAEDYTEAELAEIRRAVSVGPSIGERATELWLRPIRKPYAVMSATMDKPIGELTMPEAVSWFYCLAYATGTGLIAGTIAARILAVILGVRR